MKALLTETLTWGAVPEGFRQITDLQGNYLLVREDRAGEIDGSLCGDRVVDAAERQYRGRKPLRSIRLRDGETALVRSYLHGGLFRALSRDCFFTWPPRPFRELAITEELRRRGLRTVEVYAACVRPIVVPLYRGWLVTRELRGASDLWATLQGDSARRLDMPSILRATADALRALHREGVYHADLNLKNILIRAEDGNAVGYVIDLDKARLFLGKVPAELASKNLNRLLRSARKLDPERRYLTPSSWNELLDYYHGRTDT